MTSLFFAVISVLPACARTLQGWADHRGVTLVCLWFLDKVLGPKLGVHFKSSSSFRVGAGVRMKRPRGGLQKP